MLTSDVFRGYYDDIRCNWNYEPNGNKLAKQVSAKFGKSFNVCQQFAQDSMENFFVSGLMWIITWSPLSPPSL